MSDETPFQKLGLSCLQGKFYICPGLETEFLGCCGVDPCNDTLKGSCPQSELGNSTYSTDTHYEIPVEECQESTDAGTHWYTCSYSHDGPFGDVRPYMGCCNNQNPCQEGGCAAENMRISVLSQNETQRAIFTENLPGYSDATSGAVPEPEVTGEPANANGLGTGAIVGIAVGASAVVIILVAILMFRLGICFRKRVEEDREGGGASGRPAQEGPEMGGFVAPTSPALKPTPYRDSYMTATTAYSPVPHATPDFENAQHPGSPPYSAYESPQRFSVQSTQQSRHVSAMSGYSGQNFNNNNNTPAPYESPGWPMTGIAAEGLGMQQMQTVAELPANQVENTTGDPRHTHISELSAAPEGK